MREVFRCGCFLNTALIILGRADPATIGWMRAVDLVELYLKRFITIVTLRRPMDLPATLTRPAPMGISKYIRVG